MVGTIIVRFAKYASYCGVIFVDKRHTTKSMKIYTPRKFLHVQYIPMNFQFFIFRHFIFKNHLHNISEIFFQILLEVEIS